MFAVLGRGRWGNVTEDHGFWFSAAQSLVSGGRAMHEVRLQWGPGSLWILEAVVRVFGMRVSALVIFQFAVGVLAILGIQIFARRFLSPVERWISSAILVALIVWMVGPGNLLYPCAFAMSQALLIGLAALFVADAALRRGWGLAASLSGAVAALAFLTKQEFGVAAVLGIVSLIVLSPKLGVVQKARSLLVAGGLFLAVYFGVLWIVRDGESFRRLVEENILWPWAEIPGPWAALYRRVLGLDDPAARLIEAGNSLVDVLAIGGTFWALLYAKDLRPRARAAMGAALAGAWILWWWRWTEGSHFLPMTLVVPAVLGAAMLLLGRRRRTPGSDSSNVTARDPGAFVALALGGLVLLQREGYRGNIEAYYSGMGYALAVPVAAPLLWWGIRGPRSAGKRSLLAAAAFVAAIGWFGVGRLRTLERLWANTTPIRSDRGTVYVSNDLAPVLSSTFEFLRANTSSGDPILMMPQTYGFDFLLNRRNLLYFIWISPGYLTDEDELIARCRRTPPRAVVIFEGSFGIFHSGQFGHGFADRLVAWLDGNFPRQERIGKGTALPGRWLLPGMPAR
ncbi:MAG: hypothetical protein ACRD16_17105 [Thermoanaerobaculia bacterium]